MKPMRNPDGSQTNLEPQRILIVDDDDSILNLLAQFFQRIDIDFRTASNGREALEVMEGFPVTILITDLIMPQIDGFELMKRVKEQWPDVDVIVMTGYSKNFTYTDVVRAGASDFIQKPFPLDELEAKVNRIIKERQLRYQLQRLSVRDGLTDLYNRRHFDEKVHDEASRAARQGYPLYLLMVDLDKFKEVNDTKGHQAGDKILKIVAETLISSTRSHVDICFRHGGDEFAVLIPHATRSQAEAIAERIRTNLLKKGVAPVTISLGLAAFSKKEGQDLEEAVHHFIKRADDALYKAKDMGGNRLVSLEDMAEGAA